jgi:hypothetical protein
LPNLQEGTELPEGGTFWLRTKTQERIRCVARWKKVPQWTPPETVEIEQALQDWFQYGVAVTLPNYGLTKIVRYWGHEHDYRNSLISVRWGGVMPREIPCNKRESESLREGPFSGFPPSTNTLPEKDMVGTSLSKGKQRQKKALSEADVEVFERQKTQSKQASEVAGPRYDGQQATDTGRDGGGEVGDELNNTGSEAEYNAAEDEDEAGPPLEADDKAQPSRWQSDMLCVVDPFVRTKVELTFVNGIITLHASD